MNQMQFFNTAKTEGAKKKLLEFNAECKVIDEKHLETIDTILNVVSDKVNFHSTKLYRKELEVLDELLKFPSDKVFPSLDILRMFLVHPQASELFKVVEKGGDKMFSILGIVNE